MPAKPSFRSRILTVLNLKGGVGKTHTAWLLASVCQEQGRRILLVDTDTQANLTSSLMAAPDDRPGIERMFHPGYDGDGRDLIRRTPFAHIDLIPSSSALAPFDISNQTEWEKADLHLTLAEAIAPFRDHYDFILIDCPPRLSLVSYAALCASDGVIIPMEAADWGARGIMQVTAAVDYVQKRSNPRLHLLGYLVSRFKRARAYQKQYLKQLHAHFGDRAFDTCVPDLAQYEKSVTDRIPITAHAPGSEAASIARALFAEVERRLERNAGSGESRGRARVRRSVIPAAAL